MNEVLQVIAVVALVALTFYLGFYFGKKENKENQEALKKRIADLEQLCRFDDIPELLIENPAMIIGQKPTEKDIEWAKQKIEEYKNKEE